MYYGMCQIQAILPKIPGSHKFLIGSEPGTMATMKNISKCPGYLTPGHVNILVERVRRGIHKKPELRIPCHRNILITNVS
jgi:hypothetical protein